MRVKIHAKKSLLLYLILLTAWPGMITAMSGPEMDVKVVAKELENRFEACPRREMVIPFQQEKHKPVWAKLGFGPPTQVFADIKPYDSVLYPNTITIEFRLDFTYGPMRKSKAEATKDTNLVTLAVGVPSLRGSRYRYIYLVGSDGIRVKSREVFQDPMNGTNGSWSDAPTYPDACWDRIGVK
jgi:hypothetical protein